MKRALVLFLPETAKDTLQSSVPISKARTHSKHDLSLTRQPESNCMDILLQDAARHKVGERAIWVFSFMSSCTENTDLISCLLTDVSLFTPCPCLWVSPLISNRIHWGLPSFSCSSLFSQKPVMLITGSHVKFSYQSIIFSLKSKRDHISPQMTVSRSQFQEKQQSHI